MTEVKFIANVILNTLFCLSSVLGWSSVVLFSNWWVIMGKSLLNFAAVICIVSWWSPWKTHSEETGSVDVVMLQHTSTYLSKHPGGNTHDNKRWKVASFYMLSLSRTDFSLSKMKRSLSFLLFKHMHTHAVSWYVTRECVFNAVSSLNAFVTASLVQTHAHSERWTCICNNT